MKRTILSLFTSVILYSFTSAQTVVEAVQEHDTSLVLKLIKAGADPNQQDEKGTTPMMAACRWGDSEMVEILLLNNVSANKSCASRGRTPLMVACAYYGGVGVCRLLVDKGADVNAVSVSGMTALMFAAKNGKDEVVDYLLSAGADASKRDIGGFRAIDYAENHNPDPSIVESLQLMDFHLDNEAVVSRLKPITK